MAFIGMRHVVVAEVDTHVDGSEPTYKAGVIAGRAITGNLSKTFNDNPLRADDMDAENDNSLLSMALELGVDDLEEDAKVYMGLLKSSGTESDKTYYETSAPSKPMGTGYIRVRRRRSVTTYQVIWIYKVQFQIESENSQTKGRTIEWNTPVVNGDCMGIDTDGSGEVSYRKIKNFPTYEAAETFLNGLAGISA